MLRDLLKSNGAREKLKNQGFVKIPFLSSSEIEQLRSINREAHPDGPEWYKDEGIHMTTWCSDFDYKKRITDGLKSLFDPKLDAVFDEVRSLNHVFIIKQPGKHTTFKVHQDWSVVDETQHQSLNVWIPLHDVDADSGALWVVPGSHQTERKVRGAGYLFPNYIDHFPELEAMAISVPVRAGEALVFYHSVIHGSPPNLAQTNREVACFTVVPQEAPLQICFQRGPQDPLQKHYPKDDFVFHYSNLREDSMTLPPTDNPEIMDAAYHNTPVRKEEINALRGALKGTLG